MKTKIARPQDHESPRLEDSPVPIRLKLSALWASVMFLYVYVDIFGFYKPGTIEDILVGRVWEFDISQGWALGAMALMAIPSLMVCLPLLASARLTRRANMVVGSLFVLVTIVGTIDETWAFYWLGSVVEIGLLLLIVRLAWTWPTATSPAPTTARVLAESHQA